ncbi:MAG TPA: UPF0149 family protein [Burkholderiaceae bacterium]|nr:UPF0149 family protein [Burkholderiaceae bacterium]
MIEAIDDAGRTATPGPGRATGAAPEYAAPLSRAEGEELVDLMSCDAVPEQCMDPSMLDGYLTGLVCSPAVPPLERWLARVWDPDHGRAAPDFARASDAHRLLELIVRHANATAELLAGEPQSFEPLFDEHDEAEGGATIVDSWCHGFLEAIALDPVAWEPLQAAHPEWFHVLRLYGSEEGWDELERLDPSEMDEAAHQRREAEIAPSVRRIFDWWAQRRPWTPLVVPPAVQTVHARKVGRNEPCPCGSGRKFKHCHGAAQALRDPAGP